MIAITLPDGTVKQVSEGTTSLDVAMSISEGLARNVLAAEVDGEVWDPQRPWPAIALKLLTSRDEEGMNTLWHSSAHLMAEALESLYPASSFGSVPPWRMASITTWTWGAHLHRQGNPAVEQKMMELAKPNPFVRKEMSKADAVLLEEKGDEYKLDLLDLEDGTITFYTQGDFTDLCRGPHIPHTGHVKAAKIMAIAGAYWKGDETQKQLTRVYGVTFTKKSDLKEHLERLEQARARDHRKLGKELDLFHFSEKVGQGLPLWSPKSTS